MRRRTFAFVLGALFLTTFHLAQAQQPKDGSDRLSETRETPSAGLIAPRRSAKG